MTYLVTWKGSYQNISIARYADKVAAKTVLDGIEDPSIGGAEVDNELDLVYTKNELVTIFNKLAGPDDPQVQGFPSKAEGQRRVFSRIEDLGKGLPIIEVTTTLETNPEALASGQPDETNASAQGDTDMAAAKKTSKKAKPVKAFKAKVAKGKAVKTKANGNGLPREGTKMAKLLDLIQRSGGATLAEMLKVTGWKECRGTASVLAAKVGKKLTLIKEEGKAKRWEAQ